MAKLTITIPDELHVRLEKVRDNFVISKVCQKAIDREVEIHELISNVDDKESIIKRLILEKEKYEKSSREEGKEEGINCAKSLSYPQFKAFLNLKGKYFKNDKDDFDDTLSVNDLCDFFDVPLSEDEKKIKIITEDDEGNKNEEVWEELKDLMESTDSQWEGIDIRQYFIGFVDGIISFYDSIKEKIKDNYKGPEMEEWL